MISSIAYARPQLSPQRLSACGEVSRENDRFPLDCARAGHNQKSASEHGPVLMRAEASGRFGWNLPVRSPGSSSSVPAGMRITPRSTVGSGPPQT